MCYTLIIGNINKRRAKGFSMLVMIEWGSGLLTILMFETQQKMISFILGNANEINDYELVVN